MRRLDRTNFRESCLNLPPKEKGAVQQDGPSLGRKRPRRAAASRNGRAIPHCNKMRLRRTKVNAFSLLGCIAAMRLHESHSLPLRKGWMCVYRISA